MQTFHILTIFPNFFNSFLQESLIKKAIDKKIIQIKVYDLRKWSFNKHKQVDDKPYGGGAGMLLMAEPIIKAIQDIKKQVKSKSIKTIAFTPSGRQYKQFMAKRYSQEKHIILICGRYQGFDERIVPFLDEKISVGPYILSGGEIPAMLVVESVSRLLPGYLNNPDSLQNETKHFSNKLLKEAPQYTRPEVLQIKGKKLRVPKMLLSGDHKKIEDWKKKKQKQVKTI